jgi:diguanylate cyclase (GGDEF)-like protein
MAVGTPHSSSGGIRAVAQPDPTPVAVLVIEDSPVDAAVVRRMLERAPGLVPTIDLAPTLDAGLAHLQRGETDVVLLDLSLPDSQGLGTFTRLAEAVPGVPMIVMSASDDEAIAEEAVRTGAQDYLVKGQVTPESLGRAIRYALERHRLLASLRDLSLVDDLTGLYNRRGFSTVGAAHLQLAQRAGRRFMLVYVDLDGLKQVNDRLGHQQGDVALAKTAEILRSTFRQSDIVGRLGGDEFVVLAVEAADDTEQMLLARLQAQVNELNARSGLPFDLSLSAGVVSFEAARGYSLGEMLVRADEALYEQKRRKHGRPHAS